MKYTIEDFKEWLKEVCLFEEVDKFVKIERDGETSSPNKKESLYSAKIYTDNREYAISIIERSDDEGYLGCTMSNRKPLAGEDWTRGRDLPDGKLCKETWDKIKNSIIRTELVELAPKVEIFVTKVETGPSIE